eukprot:TRINITY_DN15479_c0_g1_i1.p1 TRINITY_DN15479_c0_g1~~TRINITY_DN15479_c0_g1_i1.p1  ORF type:complete len:146 (+),score=40.17 TRINITY_DN15479_c0_g1_i1:237-674(+)
MASKSGSSSDIGPDTSRWHVIYPIYINLKKKRKEGRLVPTEKAVDNPTMNEITACLEHMGFKSVAEPQKAYPRDFTQRGRVRVQIKKEDGTLTNENFTNKKQVLHGICEILPTYRTNAAAKATTSKGGGAKGKGGGKKKGKKGRR